MPRPINRLSARAVQTAAAGYHADGAGLYLLVTPEGTASWVFRYTFRGRKREMGLGAASLYSLADARVRRDQQRRLLADGLDPIEARRAAQTATPRTWGEAVTDFIEAHKPGWKTPAQAEQWTNSLDAYGPAASLPVAAVTTGVVLDCLRPIWTGKTETATRVRGRIERIWAAERFAGNVSGENPARWRGHLDNALPKPGKVVKVKHHPAMPWAQVPAFMARLRERDGLARHGLEFTILTAARTGETAGAGWLEIHGKLWTIPGERMKAGEEHVVPLSDAALAVLAKRPRDRPPFPLSEGGMLALLQKTLGQPYTVHGFRSSFYDWARDNGHAPEHVIDAALAHKVSDEVKAAYGRSKLLALRRDLMQTWADFLK
jgi:integrase